MWVIFPSTKPINYYIIIMKYSDQLLIGVWFSFTDCVFKLRCFLQIPEQPYGHHHDENTSLTSQKTSRTQASMLTKSAPTPAGSGSASGSGSGSASTPHTKTTDATGSTTLSASAKYAEYISNLEKYQHPPPSKRHVTFIKYRGRQCTIGMLIVFAVLVIGLVVAPVVYFTGKTNW